MMLTSIVGLFQLALFSILLTILLWKRDEGRWWFRRITGVLNEISKRRRLAPILVCSVSLLTSLTLSLLIELPEPVVHDEFSYLLAADTFSKGRITNPTHPMWQHFETFHVIHEPTYASKYPPAQGLFLAIGKVLTGYPIAGVWLSTALAILALFWMLKAWVPGRWALIGVLLAVFHPLILIWSQNYWGGSVALTGGALLLGSYRRIMRSPKGRKTWYYAFWLGLGMAILANSRPFEGMVLSLSVGIPIVIGIARNGKGDITISLARVLLPISLLLALTLGWMIFYNIRVTGKWWEMPYIAHETAYSIMPMFIWQPVRPEPAYRYKEIKDYHLRWEMTVIGSPIISVKDYLRKSLTKIIAIANSYLRMLVIIVPLIILPLVFWKDRKLKVALAMIGIFIVGLCLETYQLMLHYSSPAFGLLLIIASQCMRYLRMTTWRGREIGQSVVLALFISSLTLPLVAYVNMLQNATYLFQWRHERSRIIHELEKTDGPDLVIVRYGPEHHQGEEWVYNSADIDQSRIVWARDMDEESNRKLIDYYKGRCAWLLKVGTVRRGSVELVPLTNCPKE